MRNTLKNLRSNPRTREARHRAPLLHLGTFDHWPNATAPTKTIECFFDDLFRYRSKRIVDNKR